VGRTIENENFPFLHRFLAITRGESGRVLRTEDEEKEEQALDKI